MRQCQRARRAGALVYGQIHRHLVLQAIATQIDQIQPTVRDAAARRVVRSHSAAQHELDAPELVIYDVTPWLNRN
jgi:hypothetical protein